MMREPHRRAVSAFFYPGIHHNSKCVSGVDACFVEYATSPRWQNVAVKMLTGGYAYSPDATCVRRGQCKHSLEDALGNLDLLVFMGVAELWELSLVVLHLAVPRLEPVLDEFLLAEQSSASRKVNASTAAAGGSSGGSGGGGAGKRTNHDVDYQLFRDQALRGDGGGGGKYRQLLVRQNALDSLLYERVLGRLCAEVQRRGLWGRQVVRDYWRVKAAQVELAGGNSSARRCN